MDPVTQKQTVENEIKTLAPAELLKYLQQKALSEGVPLPGVNEYIRKNYGDFLNEAVLQLMQAEETPAQQQMPRAEAAPEVAVNVAEAPSSSQAVVTQEAAKPEISSPAVSGTVELPESAKQRMEQIKREVGAVAEATKETTPQVENQPKPEAAPEKSEKPIVPATTQNPRDVEVVGYKPSPKLPDDEGAIEDVKTAIKENNSSMLWQLFWWERFRNNLKSIWGSIQGVFSTPK